MLGTTDMPNTGQYAGYGTLQCFGFRMMEQEISYMKMSLPILCKV